jgi:hypothetical protein
MCETRSGPVFLTQIQIVVKGARWRAAAAARRFFTPFFAVVIVLRADRP